MDLGLRGRLEDLIAKRHLGGKPLTIPGPRAVAELGDGARVLIHLVRDDAVDARRGNPHGAAAAQCDDDGVAFEIGVFGLEDAAVGEGDDLGVNR